MATLITEANSVLGIEIGSIHTRAILFDVVEESYRMIAAGVTDSTFNEPFFDIGEGVFEAIARLQEITGRLILDHEGNLIIPSRGGGIEGVDRLVFSISCGKNLKAVTFGLLNDVSLESANHLAGTCYTSIEESFGINDRRSVQDQMDALLAVHPDILLVAGGTDRGASRAVARMINMISTVLQILPREERPKVLFCGNHAISKRVREVLEKITDVSVTNNVRPTIDTEDLIAPTLDLEKLIMADRMQKIGGLSRVVPLCSDQPILSSTGFRHIIQFLGKQYDPAKGVLGIDLGSAHTMAAYANHTQHMMNVYPMGIGSGLEKILPGIPVAEIQKWLPEEVNPQEIEDYLWQKTIYPESIPATNAFLAIELAVARIILRKAMKELTSNGEPLSQCFEPIIASGSVLTHVATPQQALLTLLDGIQPHGVTPIILDKQGIIPILGASIKINPLMPVQVLESAAFINLATVVVAESTARHGSTILQARLEGNSGEFSEVEIKKGSIVSLPLSSGQVGYLTLKSVKRTIVEDIEIDHVPLRIKGGLCGVVIDARGRPMSLPVDENKRRELIQCWNKLS